METEGSFVPKNEVNPAVKEPLVDLSESVETVRQLATKLRNPIPEEIKTNFIKIGDEASYQSFEKALEELAQNLEGRLAKVDPNTNFSDRRAEMKFRIDFFDGVRPIILENLHRILNNSWRGTKNSDLAKGAAWESLTNYLKQICESSGFQVTEPKVGEQFNEDQHVVKYFADNPGPHFTITEIYSLGLKINQEIKEKSEVTIYR